MWSPNKAWRGVASITTTGIEPSATRLLASSSWYVSCHIVTVEIFVFRVQGPVLQRWFVQLDKILGPSLTVKGANSFHCYLFECKNPHSSCGTNFVVLTFVQLLFRRCLWISSALLPYSWPVFSLFSGPLKEYNHHRSPTGSNKLV